MAAADGGAAASAVDGGAVAAVRVAEACVGADAAECAAADHVEEERVREAHAKPLVGEIQIHDLVRHAEARSDRTVGVVAEDHVVEGIVHAAEVALHVDRSDRVGCLVHVLETHDPTDCDVVSPEVGLREQEDSRVRAFEEAGHAHTDREVARVSAVVAAMEPRVPFDGGDPGVSQSADDAAFAPVPERRRRLPMVQRSAAEVPPASPSAAVAAAVASGSAIAPATTSICRPPTTTRRGGGRRAVGVDWCRCSSAWRPTSASRSLPTNISVHVYLCRKKMENATLPGVYLCQPTRDVYDIVCDETKQRY